MGKDILNKVLFKLKLSTNMNIDIWHVASLTLDLVINVFHRGPNGPLLRSKIGPMHGVQLLLEGETY